MDSKDLEIFNQMPFLFWVKDDDGRYLWGNKTINDFAKESVVGKTDHELVWSDNAEALHAADERVMRTGEPDFLHEHVDKSGKGDAMLSVCKFMGDLDGKRRCFGVSFVIEK